MKHVRTVYVFVGLVMGIVALSCGQQAVEEAASSASGSEAEAPAVGTSYQVDPFWPQELPNKWLLGQVIGVAVDSRDHVWIIHRGNLSNNERPADLDPPLADECCSAAPPVLEFDPEGNLVGHWGGPGDG